VPKAGHRCPAPLFALYLLDRLAIVL
jgi:hypothetical protein